METVSNESPAARGARSDIPVIDLEPFLPLAAPGRPAPDDPLVAERRAQAAAEAHAASLAIGAFYVKRHGIPQELIDRAFDQAQRFFRLPVEQKLRIAAGAPPNVRGYQPLPRREGDYKEWFFCTLGLDDPSPLNPLRGENRWPAQPAEFEPTMNELMAAMMDTGQAIMALLATSLGVSPHAFYDCYTGGGGGGLRILHYPPAEEAPVGRFGANQHTDLPPIAMIIQDDAGGLESQTRDGEWVPIRPVAGTIACQVGDAFERWTNDLYLAGNHHVRHARGKERFSLAFFMVPRAEAVIECLDSCAGPDNPRRYPPIKYGQYMAEWMENQKQ
jgi:isopenicillin N synthase-like dioxygenase